VTSFGERGLQTACNTHKESLVIRKQGPWAGDVAQLYSAGGKIGRGQGFYKFVGFGASFPSVIHVHIWALFICVPRHLPHGWEILDTQQVIEVA
jgi:hypothetical protein